MIIKRIESKNLISIHLKRKNIDLMRFFNKVARYIDTNRIKRLMIIQQIDHHK